MLEQIVAWISSIVLGIGVVWKLVERYSPKVRKALKITTETLELLDTLLDAIEDKQVTKEEVEGIIQKVQDLQTALK
jgi:hypothetical protein